MGISRNFAFALTLFAASATNAFADSVSDTLTQQEPQEHAIIIPELDFRFPGQFVGERDCFPLEQKQHQESTPETMGLYA